MRFKPLMRSLLTSKKHLAESGNKEKRKGESCIRPYFFSRFLFDQEHTRQFQKGRSQGSPLRQLNLDALLNPTPQRPG